MIKRIYSSLLALVMVVGLLPTTAWADEPDAGSGTTTTISRFNCPTDGCTVTTTDGTSFSHSDSSCPYAEDMHLSILGVYKTAIYRKQPPTYPYI